jgi:hypothetical protein
VYRLLICLPLCLALAPARPEAPNIFIPLAPLAGDQDPLPTGDPYLFLQKALERYEDSPVKGYSAILQKQERIGGRLQPTEEVEVHFREKPFSVFMHWQRGQRKADTALYVEGENDGKVLVHPAGVAGALVKVVTRDPEGEDARQSGRYTLKEFGIKKGTQRVLKAWKAAKEKGILKVEYLGVRKVREAGDKLCYTLRRTCTEPEDDGISEMTYYFDKETWLQVGSVLKKEDGKLIGEYMFREIQLNPEFKANQFQAAAVAP